MARSRGVTIFSEDQHRSDPTTGEIVSSTSRKVVSIKPSEREKTAPFFQVYTQFLNFLFRIGNAPSNVLWKFMEMSDFNRGIVRVTKMDRTRICEELGITQATYYSAVKVLKEEGIIDGDAGYWVINPEIMWKGDSVVREQLLSGELDIEMGIGVKLGWKPESKD